MSPLASLAVAGTYSAHACVTQPGKCDSSLERTSADTYSNASKDAEDNETGGLRWFLTLIPIILPS